MTNEEVKKLEKGFFSGWKELANNTVAKLKTSEIVDGDEVQVNQKGMVGSPTRVRNEIKKQSELKKTTVECADNTTVKRKIEVTPETDGVIMDITHRFHLKNGVGDGDGNIPLEQYNQDEGETFKQRNPQLQEIGSMDNPAFPNGWSSTNEKLGHVEGQLVGVWERLRQLSTSEVVQYILITAVALSVIFMAVGR